MKKHWKKIILALGLLMLSVAGYLVYIFQFKEYETADENVDKVVEEEYQVELPDGSTIIVDKEGNVIEDADGETADTKETAKGTSAPDTASENGDSTVETAEAAKDSASSEPATTSSGTAHSSTESKVKQAAGSSGSSGTTGSTDTSKPAAGSSGSKAGSESPNTNKAASESAKADTGGATVASIKQKYEPTLADIEGQAASRIGGLIGAAQSEYATKKANGESIDYAYFYNKYMGAATELENRTDSVFYAVIGSLKNELKANGLAASHADSFVAEYESRKEARKKDLISKASGM